MHEPIPAADATQATACTVKRLLRGVVVVEAARRAEVAREAAAALETGFARQLCQIAAQALDMLNSMPVHLCWTDLQRVVVVASPAGEEALTACSLERREEGRPKRGRGR